MTSAFIMCYLAISMYCFIALSVFIFDARREANDFLALANKKYKVKVQSAIALCIMSSVLAIFIAPIILYSMMFDYENFRSSFTRTISKKMKLYGMRE